MFFCLFAASCTATNEPAGEPSAIKPPPLLLPDKQVIRVFAPVNLSTQAGIINFDFDSTMAPFSALMIFKTNPPTVSPGKDYLSDISSCWGGATNMTTHPWNNFQVVLDAAVSGVYVCDPLSPIAPLSNTLVRYTGSMTAGTYYWVILGYEADYRLTYSSPLYKFTR